MILSLQVPNAILTPTYYSQHPLPSQLNLPRRLARLPPALTHTYCAPLTQLDFVFDSRERTRAVMWKVNASKGAGAQIVRAVGCWLLTADNSQR